MTLVKSKIIVVRELSFDGTFESLKKKAGLPPYLESWILTI